MNEKLWLLEPTRGREILSRAATTPVREQPTWRQIADFSSATTKRALKKATGGIAVIEIVGLIERRLSLLSYLDGAGFASEWGTNVLNELKNDRTISAAILVFDSPGGSYSGTPELGDAIRSFAKSKPIHAAVQGMCASAAYWLASQATSIAASASSELGSIGVFSCHLDMSRMLDAAGIVPTVARQPVFKAEFLEIQPLTDAAKTFMQEEVDAAYSEFVLAVARGRGTTALKVTEKFGQGRTLGPAAALATGMIDRLQSFDSVLAALEGQSSPPNLRASSRCASPQLDQLRRDHSARKAARAILETQIRGSAKTKKLRREHAARKRECSKLFVEAIQHNRLKQYWDDDDGD